MEHYKSFCIKHAPFIVTLFLIFLVQFCYLVIDKGFSPFSFIYGTGTSHDKPIIHLLTYLIFFVMVGFALYKAHKNGANLSKKYTVFRISLSVVFAFLSGLIFTFLVISIVGLALLINTLFSLNRSTPADIFTEPEEIISAIGNRVPNVVEAPDALSISTLQLHSQEYEKKNTFLYNIVLPLESNIISPILLSEKFPGMWYFSKGNILVAVKITNDSLRQVVAPIAYNAIIRKYGAYLKSEESFSVLTLNTPEYIKEVNNRQKDVIARYQQSLDEIQKEKAGVQATISYNLSILAEIPQSDPFYPQAKSIVASYNSESYGYIAQLNEAEAEVKKSIEDMKKNPLTADKQAGLYTGTVVYLRYFNEDPRYEQVFERYFTTATHEYLHALSNHGAESRDIPGFMEEGTTDYLTGEIVNEVYYPYEHEPYYGYVTEVVLMKDLIKNSSEQSLLETYFTKKDDTLRAGFENAYPNADYDSFLKQGSFMHLQSYRSRSAATQTAEAYLQTLTKTTKRPDLLKAQ